MRMKLYPSIKIITNSEHRPFVLSGKRSLGVDSHRHVLIQEHLHTSTSVIVDAYPNSIYILLIKQRCHLHLRCILRPNICLSSSDCCRFCNLNLVNFQQKIGPIPTTQHVPCSFDRTFSVFHVKIVQIYIATSQHFCSCKH